MSTKGWSVHYKLYALHAPEVECIGKGKARVRVRGEGGHCGDRPEGPVVDAGSFPGTPYDGDALAEQLEQVGIVSGTQPTTAIVDLGYSGRRSRASTFCTGASPRR